MTIPVIPLKLDLTSDFSGRNAAALAQASQWAYQLTPTIEGVLTDSQAILFDAGDAYVLAIQGTRDLRDWITDCKFLLRRNANFPIGKIHDGFGDAWDDIAKDVFQQIQAAMIVQVKPLFICGHSLGGAISIPAADYLSRQNVNVQAVYTYGQPRVGDRAFAASYNSRLGARTFRVVYEFDLVPHLPLPGLLFRYLQNRMEVYLRDHYAGEIPHFVFNRPIGRKLFSDGVMLFRAWRLLRKCAGNPITLPLALIATVKGNHSIENYRNKLN